MSLNFIVLFVSYRSLGAVPDKENSLTPPAVAAKCGHFTSNKIIGFRSLKVCLSRSSVWVYSHATRLHFLTPGPGMAGRDHSRKTFPVRLDTAITGGISYYCYLRITNGY